MTDEKTARFINGVTSDALMMTSWGCLRARTQIFRSVFSLSHYRFIKLGWSRNDLSWSVGTGWS